MMVTETFTSGDGEAALGDVRPGVAAASSGKEFSAVLDAAGQTNLVVPFGVMLLKADFVREGPDLLLIGPNGEQVLVRDYFSVEPPPNLLTEGGAVLSADTVLALAGPAAPGAGGCRWR